MGRYSEVKIFRLDRETTRCDLFVSTHARFAVDIFGTDRFVDTHPVNAKRSRHLRRIPRAATEVSAVNTILNGTGPGSGFPFGVEALTIIKRLLRSHAGGRESRVQIGAPHRRLLRY